MNDARRDGTDEEERSDRALLDAFRRGDGDAFRQLYERHRAFVLRVAMRFGGADNELALDVLQETFAWLARRAPDLELRHRLSTLLYPVARHLVRDHRVRRERYPDGDGDPDALPSPEPPPGFGDDLRDWFQGLGPLQQEILGLRFADELSLEEIAAALDIPVGTAKSRLHNALRQLREKLEHE